MSHKSQCSQANAAVQIFANANKWMACILVNSALIL